MKRSERPPLTDKQSRVLELAGMGMRDSQIAGALGLGLPTIEGHFHRIYCALDIEPHANQRIRAIFKAHRLGLINLDDLRDLLPDRG